jgi:2-haloacid dehalogenase
VHKIWEQMQFKMIQQPYRRYREILGLSLQEALNQFKVSYDPEDGSRFAHAMGSWRPFQEVPAALERLKRKFKLGIISNIDRDILSRTLTYFGVAFDVVVTAEDVRAYKPSTKGFEEALRRIGKPPERVLHAAFGLAYDLGPARQLGMKLCLVRRPGLPRAAVPETDLDVRDLAELANKLGA